MNESVSDWDDCRTAPATLGLLTFMFFNYVFKASALWDDAFYKSIYSSVCPSVCVFTVEVPFKRLFAPTSQCLISNIFRDSESLGKSNGKKCSQIWNFLLWSGLKLPKCLQLHYRWLAVCFTKLSILVKVSWLKRHIGNSFVFIPLYLQRFNHFSLFFENLGTKKQGISLTLWWLSIWSSTASSLTKVAWQKGPLCHQKYLNF